MKATLGGRGEAASTELHGRQALVTGGTRGIGLAVTRALLERGAKVLAITNAEDQVATFKREFASVRSAAVAYADVRDSEALARIRDGLAGLHILVANAGVNTRTKFLDLSTDLLQEMLDVNLTGVINSCRVFGPLVIREAGGRVVMTSSLSAIHGMDLRSVYSATKGGVSALARSLAVEWGPFGTTVNAVGPGVVRTPLTEGYILEYPERAAAYLANVPLGCLAEPEDVADVIVFLASPAARYVSGQTVIVDGGLSAGSSWW